MENVLVPAEALGLAIMEFALWVFANHQFVDLIRCFL